MYLSYLQDVFSCICQSNKINTFIKIKMSLNIQIPSFIQFQLWELTELQTVQTRIDTLHVSTCLCKFFFVLNCVIKPVLMQRTYRVPLFEVARCCSERTVMKHYSWYKQRDTFKIDCHHQDFPTLLAVPC